GRLRALGGCSLYLLALSEPDYHPHLPCPGSGVPTAVLVRSGHAARRSRQCSDVLFSVAGSDVVCAYTAHLLWPGSSSHRGLAWEHCADCNGDGGCYGHVAMRGSCAVCCTVGKRQ